jgi:hypothetical protein
MYIFVRQARGAKVTGSARGGMGRWAQGRASGQQETDKAAGQTVRPRALVVGSLLGAQDSGRAAGHRQPRGLVAG